MVMTVVRENRYLGNWEQHLESGGASLPYMRVYVAGCILPSREAVSPASSLVWSCCCARSICLGNTTGTK